MQAAGPGLRLQAETGSAAEEDIVVDTEEDTEEDTVVDTGVDTDTGEDTGLGTVGETEEAGEVVE